MRLAMVAGWTSELAAKVAKHLKTMLDQPRTPVDWNVAAAKRTNCLPSYADISGEVVLSLSGELFFSDGESEPVAPLDDVLWRNVALVSLVGRYPDLGELLPVRPPDAATCPACSGAGKVMDGRLLCGTCGGLAWIAHA
jgi:hypothetical protein